MLLRRILTHPGSTSSTMVTCSSGFAADAKSIVEMAAVFVLELLDSLGNALEFIENPTGEDFLLTGVCD